MKLAALHARGILMCVQGFWKIYAPLCFTPRQIKEGIHFTFRHIFLASCWVGAVVLQLMSDCFHVVDLTCYRTSVGQSLQLVV